MYRNGNNFFKAIEAVYQPEIIQLNTDINTSLDQEIEKHADVYTAHKAALANNNTIETLNSIPTNLDTQYYRTKLDIFGDGSCVSLNNYRAMNTGYFYIEFEAEPKTIALDNGISLVVEYVASVDIFSLRFPEAPNRRFVLATSETNALFYSNNLQHLYVERTANHIGVWLNGYLLTSSGVTLYKANTIAVSTQHNFNINAVKQCRTFNRALTGFEIARLMFQDSTKYTPYPEFGTTVSPLYATSGNAIYINFNPLAKGYKKLL